MVVSGWINMQNTYRIWDPRETPQNGHVCPRRTSSFHVSELSLDQIKLISSDQAKKALQLQLRIKTAITKPSPFPPPRSSLQSVYVAYSALKSSHQTGWRMVMSVLNTPDKLVLQFTCTLTVLNTSNIYIFTLAKQKKHPFGSGNHRAVLHTAKFALTKAVMLFLCYAAKTAPSRDLRGLRLLGKALYTIACEQALAIYTIRLLL